MCSWNQRRFSAIVAPGRRPSPLVKSRMPIPAVWKSIVDSTRSDLIAPSSLPCHHLTAGDAHVSRTSNVPNVVPVYVLAAISEIREGGGQTVSLRRASGQHDRVYAAPGDGLDHLGQLQAVRSARGIVEQGHPFPHLRLTELLGESPKVEAPNGD